MEKAPTDPDGLIVPTDIDTEQLIEILEPSVFLTTMMVSANTAGYA
jgi:hypothetical protein